jgi:hypothetical protein
VYVLTQYMAHASSSEHSRTTSGSEERGWWKIQLFAPSTGAGSITID